MQNHLEIPLACALPHQPVEGNRVEQQWKQKDIMCQAMYRELGLRSAQDGRQSRIRLV